MGAKLRKEMDLPLEQRIALAVLGGVFLVGGGAGCFLSALLERGGSQELSDYLNAYLSLAREGDLPRGLWTVLWGQLKYQLAVVILGLTALGAVGVPLIFGLRGFFFSFSVACFLKVFGERGLLPAFALFGLPALLWVPALFLSGTSGLLSAQRLLRRSSGSERGGPAFSDWSRAGLCAGLCLAAGLLEYWVVPVLLRAAARVVL